ncbi:LysM peptidoglycan-binding domain-containing protein [Dethiosulfatarculus sandiegensis]|uniref:Peptidoglycan-binding protein n=1 Tax=Dethiosulfatarculus sandiegensis TaxID=1429043 RepID=A0A0D2J701_9BACT|nr:LysM peptidoglycan-binding domain-containing protein [Dethiosulfatarculus sandiegensis]KIX11451.1 peptidoglycan-binding protein [Dethiosulfatarculus sandiegensis]
MRKLVKMFPWIAVVVALGMLSGCAAICGVDEEKPAPAPPPPPKQWKAKPAPVTDKPAPPPALPTTYTVEKCDDLYTISAKPQIYNDPWLWPLLWDANKDKIQDPNKIKEGTVLTIQRGVDDQAKADARDRAKKFPKYIPPAGAKRYCPPK